VCVYTCVCVCMRVCVCGHPDTKIVLACV